MNVCTAIASSATDHTLIDGAGARLGQKMNLKDKALITTCILNT